jgi:hypothetical protein
VVFLVVIDVDERADRLLWEVLVRTLPERDNLVSGDMVGKQRNDTVPPLPVVDRDEVYSQQ